MRALVLLGGGSKGAYQVGAISHLIGERGVVYDMYCGVSVGALNSAMLSMFKEGDERNATATLLKVWHGISTLAVKKSWRPFGLIHMLWKPSVYDSSPLIDLVKSTMDATKIRSSGKSLAVSAVSLNTGEFRTFWEDHPAIIDAVLASSAFPAMLTPIKIDGQLWIDGGLRSGNLLKSAIDKGIDSIDVIMTSPAENPIEFSKDPNAVDVIVRSLDVISDEMMEADLRVTQLINRLVDAKRLDKKNIKLRVLRPKYRLPAKTLEFDPKEIKYMIDLGHNDALTLSNES